MWALFALALAVNLVVAFGTVGSEYDLTSYSVVAGILGEDPLGLYTALTPPNNYEMRWPYPSGYLPWVFAADALSGPGLPFHAVVSLPAIAANVAIAWLVQDHLGARGAPERTRLAAAGLVAVGPSFVLVSGFHGQFDAVAFLPAVAAVWLWERRPPGRRALACGLLIGVGAALKTAPAALLLVLLPLCRDRREAAALAGAAIAVPLACLAPWLLQDATSVRKALSYVGVPGYGGITLALDPRNASTWVQGSGLRFDGALGWVVEHRFLVSAVTAAGLALLLARARAPAPQGAVLLMLGIYAFGTGFFPQYLLWGLPFLLMAGHLRAVAAVQVVTLVPFYLAYTGARSSDRLADLFAAMMLGLWLAWLAGFVVLARRALQSSQAARNSGASAWR